MSGGQDEHVRQATVSELSSLLDGSHQTHFIPAQSGPVDGTVPLPPLTLDGCAGFPRVNLLPPEIAAARRLRRLQTGLAGGIAAAVVLVLLLALGAAGSVSDAQVELDAAQARGQQLDAQVLELGDVRATYERVRASQAMLAAALGSEVRWSRYLNDLSLSVPDGVWLTGFTVSAAPATAAPPAVPAGTPAPSAAPATGPAPTAPGPAGGDIATVTVEGMASDHDAVAAWLESLAGQVGYTDPYFSAADDAVIGAKHFVHFSSTVSVTTAALSGCYTDTKTGC